MHPVYFHLLFNVTFNVTYITNVKHGKQLNKARKFKVTAFGSTYHS